MVLNLRTNTSSIRINSSRPWQRQQQNCVETILPDTAVSSMADKQSDSRLQMHHKFTNIHVCTHSLSQHTHTHSCIHLHTMTQIKDSCNHQKYPWLTFPDSCSDLTRMHSTRLRRSLQDMVWMVEGRDSSWTFLEKRLTASDRSCRGSDWRTWWTRSARVLYARGLQPIHILKLSDLIHHTQFLCNHWLASRKIQVSPIGFSSVRSHPIHLLCNHLLASQNSSHTISA